MGIRYTEAFIEQALYKVYSRGERTVMDSADAEGVQSWVIDLRNRNHMAGSPPDR